MVTICLQCGDKGFPEALVYCDKCQTYAVHKYCLDVLPKPLDKYVVWLCCDCEPNAVKPSAVDEGKPLLVGENECKSVRRTQVEKRSLAKSHGRKRTRKATICSLTKSDLLKPASSSSLQTFEVPSSENGSLKNDENYEKPDSEETGFDGDSYHEAADSLETKNSLVPTCDLQVIESSSCEYRGIEQKLHRQNSLDQSNFYEEEESLETKNSEVMIDIADRNCYTLVQPIKDPIWRGSISIFSKDYGTTGGLFAHLSSIACSKVRDEAIFLPRLLSTELLPRSAIWPREFCKSGPSADSIALYFFPDNERNENVFDCLVDDMTNRDLAMKVLVENAELLIYASNTLPMDYWRFQAKFYLWGVFRGKQRSGVAVDEGCNFG